MSGVDKVESQHLPEHDANRLGDHRAHTIVLRVGDLGYSIPRTHAIRVGD